MFQRCCLALGQMASGEDSSLRCVRVHVCVYSLPSLCHASVQCCVCVCTCVSTPPSLSCFCTVLCVCVHVCVRVHVCVCVCV